MTILIDPITLSGLLAEAGVARLSLMHPDGTTSEIAARHTDLPGVLRAATVGTVLRTPLGDAVVTADGIQWSSHPHPPAQSTEVP